MSLSDVVVMRFADGDEVSEVWSANVLRFCVEYVKLHPTQKVVQVYRRKPGKRVPLTREFRKLMEGVDGNN